MPSVGTGISTTITIDTFTDNTMTWIDNELFGIYLNLDINQVYNPQIVFPIISNDPISIIVDNTNYNLTDIASPGSTYIGEHYLDNLSVINGAAVETLDSVNYTNLDITGGFLQADNVILSGKLNNQNNLFTLFAKFFKNLFHPDNNKYSNRVAKTTGKKDNFERVVLNLEPTQIEPLALSNGEPQRLNETENPKSAIVNPKSNHPVRVAKTQIEKKENPQRSLRTQRLKETKNPVNPVNPVKKIETVRLASLSPVSSDSEVVISDAGSAIQLPAIEKKGSDVTLSLPKGLVSNSTNTQRSNETVNVLDPVNPVKDSESLTPDPRSLAPAFSGGVDPQYTYDLTGNITRVDTPFGSFNYTYDVLNRLTSITNPNNETTTFTYDALGRRASITYANGVVTTYSYDAASRLTGMSTDLGATNISSYSYTYDLVGNRTSMTDQAGVHNYTYDSVYRLTDATHPQAYNPTEKFTYDPVGNRQTSQISNSYVYDNLNRLADDDQFTYSYDNNGNMLSKTDKISSAVTTYQYDSENSLIQVVTPTNTVQYQYDGFGRRIAKTVNGVITKYVYDQEDILFELDRNDQLKAIYTHKLSIDEPLSVDRDTNGDGTLDTTYYYHYDGLGSVTAMTDISGNVVQTYTYDSFGKIVNQTGSVENSITYTGREFEQEAELYFYRARYYDPKIGRFLTHDPIGFSGGINFYTYVQNNPINFTDPTGENVVFFIKAATAAYTTYKVGTLVYNFCLCVYWSNKTQDKIEEIKKQLGNNPVLGIPAPDEVFERVKKTEEWLNAGTYCKGAVISSYDTP